MQLDKPIECASGGDPLLLYKNLYLLFFPLVRILCAIHLESRKKLLTWCWCGKFGFHTNPFRTPLLCIRVIGKTSGLISRNNFVKKKKFVCIGHHDNALARCDLIFLLLRCQGVWNKTCTQLSLSQILFQNPKNYSLGNVQRFFYHFLCDLRVIFEQISNSSIVYLSSSQFWMATSHIIFYQLPSISKSRIIRLVHIPIDLFLNKILCQLSVHFHHPWHIKKTDITRQVITHTLSRINEALCVNGCWLIVLSLWVGK